MQLGPENRFEAGFTGLNRNLNSGGPIEYIFCRKGKNTASGRLSSVGLCGKQCMEGILLDAFGANAERIAHETMPCLRCGGGGGGTNSISLCFRCGYNKANTKLWIREHRAVAKEFTRLAAIEIFNWQKVEIQRM